MFSSHKLHKENYEYVVHEVLTAGGQLRFSSLTDKSQPVLVNLFHSFLKTDNEVKESCSSTSFNLRGY